MRILIAEDDFVSGKLMETLLSSYGQTSIAVNGQQAIEMFQDALDEKEPYKLICLDIMMPLMNGQDVLREIRAKELEKNIQGLDSAKIIMVTALSDFNNISKAFREQCDAYLVKPIEREKVVQTIEKLGFVKIDKD